MRRKARFSLSTADAMTTMKALTVSPAITDMDIDEATGSTLAKASRSKSSGRIQKRGRNKARASTVFPVYKKGKRIGPHLSMKQRRKSLRP